MIVTSCYSKNATQTLSEIMFSLVLRELEKQGHLRVSIAEKEKALKKIRKDEIEKQPSYSEYMECMKERLIKMEFCEDDIAMLLDKYAEVYQPLK